MNKYRIGIKFVLLFFCCSFTAVAQEHKELSESGESKGIVLESSLNNALGEQAAAAYAKVIDPETAIRWNIVLPSNEARAMLVFINPDGNAKPQQTWPEVLNELGVVWVSAENYGNDKLNMERILTAFVGAEYAAQELSLQELPRYVSGMSGGGRISSIIVEQFPDVFDGAIFMLGVNRPDPLSDEQIALMNQRRYVFLTGRKDFNRRETKQAFNDYQSSRVKNIKLIDVPGLAHRYPNTKALKEALEFLLPANL
jgi:hypothetical protein